MSLLNLDQAESSLALARENLADEIAVYRDRLETFKVAMGLSVRAPVVLDRGIVASFDRVFDQAGRWQERSDRNLQQLRDIIKGPPALGEVVVAGRPILALMGGSRDQQDEALTSAARLAIQNRKDLEKGQAPGEADAVELDIRSRIRRLFRMRRAYEAQQRLYELSIRLIDQGLDQVAAPPLREIDELLHSATVATGLTGLLAPETKRRNAEDRLVTIWTSFQAERLALYRELGILPYDDWKSFFNDLSAR